jgi:hypothetical protein
VNLLVLLPSGVSCLGMRVQCHLSHLEKHETCILLTSISPWHARAPHARAPRWEAHLEAADQPQTASIPHWGRWWVARVCRWSAPRCRACARAGDNDFQRVDGAQVRGAALGVNRRRHSQVGSSHLPRSLPCHALPNSLTHSFAPHALLGPPFSHGLAVPGLCNAFRAVSCAGSHASERALAPMPFPLRGPVPWHVP